MEMQTETHIHSCIHAGGSPWQQQLRASLLSFWHSMKPTKTHTHIHSFIPASMQVEALGNNGCVLPFPPTFGSATTPTLRAPFTASTHTAVGDVSSAAGQGVGGSGQQHSTHPHHHQGEIHNVVTSGDHAGNAPSFSGMHNQTRSELSFMAHDGPHASAYARASQDASSHGPESLVSQNTAVFDSKGTNAGSGSKTTGFDSKGFNSTEITGGASAENASAAAAITAEGAAQPGVSSGVWVGV